MTREQIAAAKAALEPLAGEPDLYPKWYLECREHHGLLCNGHRGHTLRMRDEHGPPPVTVRERLVAVMRQW